MRFAAVAIGLLTALYFLPSKTDAQCSTVYRSPSYSSYSYPSTSVYAHSKTVYPAVVNYEHKVKEIVVPILQPFPFFIDPRISYVYNAGTYVGVPLVPGPAPTAIAGHAQGGHVIGGHTAAASSSGVSGHPPSAAPAVVPSHPHTASRVHAAPSYAKPAYNVSSTPPPLDVDALIDRIEARVRQRSGASAGAAVEDGPPPVPGYNPAPAPAYSAPSHAPQADYTPSTARTMASVLQGKCGRCHTGDSSKGDFVIFESRGVLSPSFDHAAAMDAINEGRMPPTPSPPLSEADRAVVASGR